MGMGDSRWKFDGKFAMKDEEFGGGEIAIAEDLDDLWGS
jgi:hypothetical protein